MRRIPIVLLLAGSVVSLPACQMNERLSGTVFGAGGGAVVGGVAAGSVTGGLIGAAAGGLIGYVVGDYLADRRERVCGVCPPAQPQPQPCPTEPCAPSPAAPATDPKAPCPPSIRTPSAPPLAPAGTGPRVGAVKTTNPDLAAARAALERGRRARTAPEARRAYEEAVRLDPRSGDAWNALGLNQLAAGEVQAARASFGRAIEVEPGHYAAARNLAWASGGPR